MIKTKTIILIASPKIFLDLTDSVSFFFLNYAIEKVASNQLLDTFELFANSLGISPDNVPIFLFNQQTLTLQFFRRKNCFSNSAMRSLLNLTVIIAFTTFPKISLIIRHVSFAEFNCGISHKYVLFG